MRICNAKVFYDNGFAVTGIEISETAIEIAKKLFNEGFCEQYAKNLTIYHGSVSYMPFDHKCYDGVFCYALIHLLGKSERSKLIRNCYKQLKPNGYMVFVSTCKETETYGQGKKISKDRFKTKHGVNLFYYDSTSVND